MSGMLSWWANHSPSSPSSSRHGNEKEQGRERGGPGWSQTRSRSRTQSGSPTRNLVHKCNDTINQHDNHSRDAIRNDGNDLDGISSESHESNFHNDPSRLIGTTEQITIISREDHRNSTFRARASMPPPSSSSYTPRDHHQEANGSHSQGNSLDGAKGRSVPRSYRSSTNYTGDYQDLNVNVGASSSTSRRLRDEHDQYLRPSASPTPTPSSSPSLAQELHRMTQLLISSDTLARQTKRESEKRLDRIEDSLEARMEVMNGLLGEVRDLLEGEKEGREEVMGRFDMVIGRLDRLEQKLHRTKGTGTGRDTSRAGRDTVARGHSTHQDQGRGGRDSRESSFPGSGPGSGYSAGTARDAASGAGSHHDRSRQSASYSSSASASRQQHLRKQIYSQLQPTSQAQKQKQRRSRRQDQHQDEDEDGNEINRQSSSTEVNAFLDFDHDTVNTEPNDQYHSGPDLPTPIFDGSNGSTANTGTMDADYREFDSHQQDMGMVFNDMTNDNGDTGGLFIDIVGDEFQPPDMDIGIDIDIPPMTSMSMDSTGGIDPRDIMRPPKTITPAPIIIPEVQDGGEKQCKDRKAPGSQNRNMRTLVAATIAREKRKSAAIADHESNSEGLPDSANGNDETRPPRSKRAKRKAPTPTPPPSAPSSESESESAGSDSEDEEGANNGKLSKKPPARRPFPSRLPVADKPAPTASRRGKPDRRSSKSPDTKPDAEWPPRRRSGRQSTVAAAKKEEPKSKSQSPISIGSSESTYIAKKKKRYSYSSKYTQAGTARVRKYRGATRLAEKCLAPSDGKKKTEAEWPRKGPNTARGRLEEIICDVCKGRCHWSCAGIPEEKDMTNETWNCPDCTFRIEEEETDRELIDTVQQIKCIRFNCILREKRALDHEEGEETMYFVERIVGRKCAKTDPETGEKTYEYLVKWDGYDMDECTWEPSTNLAPHFTRLHDAFLQKIKRTHSRLEATVCILPEAIKCWDEETVKSKVLQSQSQSGDEGKEDQDDEDELDEDEDGDGDGEGRKMFVDDGDAGKTSGERDLEGQQGNNQSAYQGENGKKHDEDEAEDENQQEQEQEQEREVDELDLEGMDQLLSPEKQVERERENTDEQLDGLGEGKGGSGGGGHGPDSGNENENEYENGDQSESEPEDEDEQEEVDEIDVE
ncbi:hypothetical protein IAT40_006940 [Kwoniella sp. CBS 6097]